MVDLVRILADVAANSNQFNDQSTIFEKSLRATELGKRLEDWTSNLPRALDYTTASLTDSELVIKQKTVLRLRKCFGHITTTTMKVTDYEKGSLNFRVLIHRPFLFSNTTEPNSMLSRHVLSCVESSRELIRFVYETYLYRPYFRTW